MMVRLSKVALPTNFSRHPAGGEVVAEADVPVRRLRAKVLVFRTPRALRRFWRDALGKDLGRGALGAVNGLAREVISFRGKREVRWLEVDRRYFCVIGLTVPNLRMEVISHESTHAGFCYARRKARDFWQEVDELDEEKVCYPAGRVAGSINRFLHDEGLYQ